MIALFQLKVLKATKLHINCRFLLTLWTLDSVLVFSCHILLGVFNLVLDGGYLADNIIEPALRNNAYVVEMSAIFFNICIEIMLATERVISSIDPEQYYHRNKLAMGIILPIMVLSLFFAYIVGINSAAGHFVVTGMVSFWLDVAIISINTFATRYCKRRNMELYGKCSLNARYQVKEASDMSSSMQKALIISFSMKNSVNTIFLASCYALDDVTHACLPILFETPFGILETLYSLNMSLNGGFLMLWLLQKHPRLRRNARRLLRSWSSLSSVRTSTKCETTVLKVNEADVYMDALKRAWM